MLFVLDESLCEELDKKTPNPKLIGLLEDLAVYRQAGRNLVFATGSVLLRVKNCSRLMSRRAAAVYERLERRQSEMRAVRSIFSRRIEITNGHGIELVPSDDPDPKIFRIPYHDLTLDNFCEPILLAENLNDTELYEIIAKVWLSSKVSGSASLNLDFDPRGGGGNTISREYQSIQDRKRRLCLCIVDSDQKTPSTGFGETAKRLRKIDDSTQILTKYLIIPARDVENLLPTDSLEHVTESKNSSNNLLFFLEEIADRLLEGRFYLDIKNGLKMKELRTQSTIEEYWKNTLQEVGLDVTCECEPNECSCVIVHGLGDKALRQCLDNDLHKRTIKKVRESLSSDPLLAEKWESVGELVAAWCVAGSRFR